MVYHRGPESVLVRARVYPDVLYFLQLRGLGREGRQLRDVGAEPHGRLAVLRLAEGV